jgi:7,8-dihydropterin-6-yl-methyl-4-(beta-D-ribofuranosyl)aminobenzene 5'-phosphate synthase
MNMPVHITALVENTTRGQGLLGEHGLAFWIDTGDHRVLFDTGQGLTLVANAHRLLINLARANAIVLSHGHYDHTGGLRHALNLAPDATLFMHPQVPIRRYSGYDGTVREIGMASLSEQELVRESHRIVWTTHPTEIVPGIFVTGEIPRKTTYEDTGGNFFLDAACHKPDPVADDQAVYFDIEPGVVVILGCGHAGIINTLNYIRDVTQRPIHAVLGGMHLVNASPQRLSQTLIALTGMNIKKIVPAHCTGARAMAALWREFPNQIAECSVGKQWFFF